MFQDFPSAAMHVSKSLVGAGSVEGMIGACRSFNSYIDYPNRGQTYETQHDEFHNSDTPNRFLAYGALVGGPGADDKYASASKPTLPADAWDVTF